MKIYLLKAVKVPPPSVYVHAHVYLVDSWVWRSETASDVIPWDLSTLDLKNIYFFVCIHGCIHSQVPTCVEVRGQIVETGSHHVGPQTWWQAPLPVELLSYCTTIFFLRESLVIIFIHVHFAQLSHVL